MLLALYHYSPGPGSNWMARYVATLLSENDTFDVNLREELRDTQIMYAT